MQAFDYVIIGAGIAGSGIAYALSPFAKVLVLEATEMPGYHTTGRSAAFYAETYGGPVVQPLTTASKDFFYHPPKGFTDVPLIKERGALHIFDEPNRALANQLYDSMKHVDGVRIVSGDELRRLAPMVRDHRYVGAVYDPACSDLDVAALHQAYLKAARRSGAVVSTNAELIDARFDGDHWELTVDGQLITAGTLVNAAGAWADVVARRCGVQMLGLTPKRRTVITLPGENQALGAMDLSWPLIINAEKDWYFKPEGDGFLVSPGDQVPSAPCDAQPEEDAVAYAAHYFEETTKQPVTKVLRRWAGLRTFARDNAPVIGFDADNPNFFWSVGQGGWGIQTSPAWTALAASMLHEKARHKDLPDVKNIKGLKPELYQPNRFQRTSVG